MNTLYKHGHVDFLSECAGYTPSGPTLAVRLRACSWARLAGLLAWVGRILSAFIRLFSPRLTGTKLAQKQTSLETFARRVCCNYTWYYDFKNPSQLINIQFNTNVGEIGKTNSIPVRGDGAFMWEIFIPLHWDHLTQGGTSHDQADSFPIWTRNDFSYKRDIFWVCLKKFE